MFIIGARVCDSVRTSDRVQEAVMNPVVVRDRRNKANEKSHPPKLDDRVHRLEEIANDGAYCKRLEENHIRTVQDFLRALNKNPDNLAKVLKIKKEHKSWEKMVRHAKDCCLKGKHELQSCRNSEGNVVLFFNWVHFLVGAVFDGHYTSSDKFDPAQQAIVDKLRECAYDQLDDLKFDHVMKGDFPVQISVNTDTSAGPSYMSTAVQPNHSGGHTAHQVGGIAAAEGLNHAQIVSSFANLNDDPSSALPDHHNKHDYQDQCTGPAGQEQQFPSAFRADLCHNPFGQLDSCLQTTDFQGFYPVPGAEDDELAFLLYQANSIDQPDCVAPGFDQVEPQRQHFLHSNDILGALTSMHSNITLTTQQLTLHGAPGPAQVGMQSQGQAPLPSNGPTVSEASTSTQNQGNLAPQQWFQCQGSIMPWDEELLSVAANMGMAEPSYSEHYQEP